MTKADLINNITAMKTNIEDIPSEFRNDPDIINALVSSWSRFIQNNPDALFSVSVQTLNIPQVYYVVKKKCMENLRYNPYFAHNLPEKIKKDPEVLMFLRSKNISLSSKSLNWYKKAQMGKCNKELIYFSSKLYVG